MEQNLDRKVGASGRVHIDALDTETTIPLTLFMLFL
jgi:hypothetical protein